MSEYETYQLPMFSVEAFPAKTSALPTRTQQVLTAHDRAYGTSISVLFASLSRDGSWLKTSEHFYQVMLDGTLERFSDNFPASGTMRNGKLFRRSPLVPPTDVTECGLLPTPQANLGLISSYGSGTAELLIYGDGKRKSGVSIGSSLMWAPQLYKDWLINGKKGAVNPRFCEWLMGFPDNWTDFTSVATPSSHRLPSGSGDA